MFKRGVIIYLYSIKCSLKDFGGQHLKNGKILVLNRKMKIKTLPFKRLGSVRFSKNKLILLFSKDALNNPENKMYHSFHKNIKRNCFQLL